MSVDRAEYDVAIVGYGPVGQTLAALLGAAGHRVAVFERFAGLYDLPRAVHVDHEVMRIWQEVGVVDEIAGDLLPIHEYSWFGADGEPIMTIQTERPAPSGWESDYMFFQPYLEAALDRAARSHPTVEVHRGWTAQAVDQRSGAADLTLRRVTEAKPGRLVATDETRTVTARYVIGADGANSLVRQAAGIAWEDLGFRERWLTLDLRPHDMEALAHLPSTCQWCDPQRPHMHTRNGGSHRRWEFMLLPGERAEDYSDPARVWELLRPWIHPGEGKLVRHAVYEFRSLLAQTMRRERILLAGDAAHLMPPFMGQGLCSGMRDAHNLAWKLDLVLRGEAEDRLLDSYAQERRPQNDWIVRLSMEMGRVSCVLDREQAERRDAGLRASEGPGPVSLPPIGAGVVHPGTGDRAGEPLPGTLAVQGRVAANGREGLFDEVAGRGFALIVRSGDPRAALAPGQASLLDRLGTTFASLEPEAPSGVSDLDGRLSGWLERNGAAAVVVRPDHYVFGATADAAGLPALVEDLARRLAVNSPAPA